MGSLLLENHWNLIVLASVREFIDAEERAVGLSVGTNADAARAAAYDALRRGMVAAIFLHHFAEVALNRNDPALQGMKKTNVYAELEARTVAPDQSARPEDWKILGEVADAIKHGSLNAGHIRHVKRDGRVIEWTHEPASMFNEGKLNNDPQIIVVTSQGTRSLRAVMENLCTTWVNWLGVASL